MKKMLTTLGAIVLAASATGCEKLQDAQQNGGFVQGKTRSAHREEIKKAKIDDTKVEYWKYVSNDDGSVLFYQMEVVYDNGLAFVITEDSAGKITYMQERDMFQGRMEELYKKLKEKLKD